MFTLHLSSRRGRAVALTSVVVLSTFTAIGAEAQAVSSVQQDRQSTLQASQPSTVVPPVAYRSVFADMPQGVESTTLDWKAANASVGQFKRGYADLVKWEQEQAAKAASKATPSPVNSALGKP